LFTLIVPINANVLKIWGDNFVTRYEKLHAEGNGQEAREQGEREKSFSFCTLPSASF
jgi:hypothetical protein